MYLDSGRYSPFVKIRTVFPHTSYSPMAKNEILFRPVLLFLGFLFLLPFKSVHLASLQCHKRCSILLHQSLPAVNGADWVWALPAASISILYDAGVHLKAAASPPKGWLLCSALPQPGLRRCKYLGMLRASLLQQHVASRGASIIEYFSRRLVESQNVWNGLKYRHIH